MLLSTKSEKASFFDDILILEIKVSPETIQLNPAISNWQEIKVFWNTESLK